MNRLFALLTIIALAGCSKYSDPRPPIPVYQVLVDGVSHEVSLRRWCTNERRCDMTEVDFSFWVVGSNGKIHVMLTDQELRFKRGYFVHSTTTDQRWVQDEAGDYLIATTPSHRIMIIHFPLSAEEMARIRSKSEGQVGGF